MATTTPNYGWPVPTSTDLVKDGATAIEALGDAIDATVFGLGSGLTAYSDYQAASVSLPAGTVYSASIGTDPAVTVTTGTSVLVILQGRITCSGNFNFIGLAVSGATTSAADDNLSANVGAATVTTTVNIALVLTVTAGSNTFTMKYRNNVSGSGAYANRRLIVIPLA